MHYLPDASALVVALVLVPATYPRNRFFDLYHHHPVMRRARLRAAELRSVVRHLGGQGPGRVDAFEEHYDAHGGCRLHYQVQGLRFQRTVWLDALEVAVVQVALAQVRKQEPSSAARARVQEALRKLAEAA